MDTILQDLRYAARKLVRVPGFTLVAVATLALAIGATTAVYSIVDGVLLEPLPFRAPDQLVRLESTGRDGKPFPLSPSDYLDYRDQATSFSGVAHFNVGFANFATGTGDPVRLDRVIVDPTFFSVLGLAPLRGRFFASNEGAPGVPNVVVISDKVWRSRFAASPNVIGQTVLLDERPFTIVGVAPPTATYPQPTDMWTPRTYQHSADPSARGGHAFFAVARLKDGVSIERARQEVRAIAKQLGERYPQMDSEFGANVVPLQDQVVGNLRPTLFSILGAVVFVLLIACANVANLLLVRASSRSGEMAVRAALGAGTGRILRQLMIESMLLTLAGAALGVALAAWTVRTIAALGPRLLPRLQDVAINGRAMGVASGLAVVTGLIFGLVPALYAARPDTAAMLRESVRGSGRAGARRLRSGLIVAETALAVVLLVGAGLLIKSFVTLMRVDLGFRSESVTTFDLPMPPAKYGKDQMKIAAVNDIVARLSSLPGTQAVGVTGGRPLARMMMMTMFDVVGEPPNDPKHRTVVEIHPASPSFFGAMGIPLRNGRVYGESENRRDGRPVVVVNEEFARRYFRGQNVIGKQIVTGVGYNEQLTPADTNNLGGEIVGVVGDVKQRGLSSDAFPIVYVPFNALPSGLTSVVVRSGAPVSTVESAIRREVHNVDPRLPVVGLNTMAQVVADSVAQPRFYMLLLAAFATIAVVLAAIGIYGVISYTVAQRSRELGIRIALGASKQRVLRLVIGEGMSLTAIGVGIGLAAAFALTRVIRSMLFHVDAVDPLTFAAVAASLIVVALLASWLPARRAAAVDPLIAMRVE